MAIELSLPNTTNSTRWTIPKNLNSIRKWVSSLLFFSVYNTRQYRLASMPNIRSIRSQNCQTVTCSLSGKLQINQILRIHYGRKGIGTWDIWSHRKANAFIEVTDRQSVIAGLRKTRIDNEVTNRVSQVRAWTALNRKTGTESCRGRTTGDYERMK